MCGIAGMVSRSGAPVDAHRLRLMTESLVHRGPDDAGFAFVAADGTCQHYVDPDFASAHPGSAVLDSEAIAHVHTTAPKLGFGHRRLAIIDPGPSGHQPMALPDRSALICYNGETYNFPALRAGLSSSGIDFTTGSDTEVVLQHWRRSGLDGLVDLDGMFAFALFDQATNEVVLVRDRFGVKPLYWAATPDFILFASEAKALFASGLVAAEIDPAGLAEYCTFQNVLRAETIWKGVHLLPAGHLLRVMPGESSTPQPVEFHSGYSTSTKEEFESARLTELFEAAVTRQLISDVPVGSFLSGGMDSGSIVSVAGRTLPRLHTFTGGFDLTNVSGIEQGNDERHLAEQLSYLLQTEHYSVVLKSGDMPAAMERLTWHMDDPRVGMCYPNWYTSKLASKFVKVCMAGTGGDELFGGYPWRYRAGVQARDPHEFSDLLFSSWHRLVPQDELGELLMPEVLQHAESVRASFDQIVDRAIRDSPGEPGSAMNLTEAVLRFDFKTFLNGLLITDDHVSMAHSLETRVPFLDNDLAEFAWGLPTRAKFDVDVLIANPTGFLDSVGGKLLLRDAMTSFLPASFTQQKKQGFSPPDENWYRGESLDYVKDVLFDPVTMDRPWFNQPGVERLLSQHVSGERNNRLLIWSLLSLEYVQRHFADQPASTA